MNKIIRKAPIESSSYATVGVDIEDLKSKSVDLIIRGTGKKRRIVLTKSGGVMLQSVDD